MTRSHSFACLLAGLLLVASSLRAQEFIPASPKPPVVAMPDELDHAGKLFVPGRFTGSNGAGIVYRLLSPASVPANAKFPLVVVLHGSGAIGTDNAAQMGGLALSWALPANRQRFPAYVLAPQAAARTATYAESKTDGLLASKSQPPLEAILQLVDQLRATLPIDPARIYVMGFSMGASGAYHSLLLRPKLFAAALMMSGVPPERSLAPQLAGVPLLITHGNIDMENPFAPDRVMFNALQAAPGTKARFREYDNLDHNAPADIRTIGPEGSWWREWMFAQRR